MTKIRQRFFSAISFAAVVAALSAAPGTFAAAHGSSASTIVPGQRVGCVRLGDALDAVIKRLGPPKTGDAAMGKSWQTWYAKDDSRHRLDIYSVHDFTGAGPAPDRALVRQIRTTSPWFSVAPMAGKHRVSPGSALSTVLHAFPKAVFVKGEDASNKKSQLSVYDDINRGIAFEIWRGANGDAAPSKSRCAAILIHPAGKSVTNEYLPAESYDPKDLPTVR